MILQRMIRMDLEAEANGEPLPFGIIRILPGDEETFIALVVDSG